MSTKDVTVRWDDPNFIEKGYKVYRSSSPMDINNLPIPIGDLPKNTTEYIDHDRTIGEVLYYRVSAWMEGVEVVSGEISIEVAGAYSYDVFGDGSITMFLPFDDVFNDIDGTYNATANNVSFKTGYYGMAATSSGNSSLVTVPYTHSGSTPVTVSLWLYLSAYRRAGIANFDTYGFGSWLENNGTLYFCKGSYNDNPMSLSESGLTLNEWHHLCFMHDGSDGKYYINGQLKKTVVNMRSGGGEFYLMGDSRLSQYNDQCLASGSKIDHVRVFNRSLTSSEVNRLYTDG